MFWSSIIEALVGQLGVDAHQHRYSGMQSTSTPSSAHGQVKKNSAQRKEKRAGEQGGKREIARRKSLEEDRGFWRMGDREAGDSQQEVSPLQLSSLQLLPALSLWVSLSFCLLLKSFMEWLKGPGSFDVSHLTSSQAGKRKKRHRRTHLSLYVCI